MYESDAIIDYLFTTYGDSQVPLPLRMGFFTTLTAGLALAPRWVWGCEGGWECVKFHQALCVFWAVWLCVVEE